ncbi:MAG: hypothetical protein J6562_05690 [Candidatus Schmidhempelia sp.]|nr:hypothetical protein [Candidatus Schmidhempelia sp.]
MWQTILKPSYFLIKCIGIFYLVLALLLIAELVINRWQWGIGLIMIICYWEFRCSYQYVLSLYGNFAVIIDKQQIYWHKQRWQFYQPPLMLQFVLILNLQSLRNRQRITLCLLYDQLPKSEWRTLCYLLHNSFN